MEQRWLAYNECFLEIYGDPSPVLALLPQTVTAAVVAPDMIVLCKVPDLSFGSRKNLAHQNIQGRRVVISGSAPAVAFLLAQFAASASVDASPRPAVALTVYFLTVPAVAPHPRRVTCYAPRPVADRRGHQHDDLFA